MKKSEGILGGKMSASERLMFIVSNAGFDWYQTTIQHHDSKPELVYGYFAGKYPNYDLVQISPKNGYTSSAAIVDPCDGKHILEFMWGGNDGINVKCTGIESIAFYELLKSSGFEHLPTRVDVAIDYTEAGFYDRSAKKLIKMAKDKGLALSFQGDWERGISRTLYIGSQHSACRVCFYEKGYERKLVGHPDFPNAANHTRLEMRIRPNKKHREFVSSLSAASLVSHGDLFHGSLCAAFGGGFDKRLLGSLYTVSDFQRSQHVMLKQYGATLRNWRSGCSDDSEFLAQLMLKLEEYEA